MKMRLGGPFDRDSSIPPPNTGLNYYAQKRLDNVVSRAVARHQNSLFVDGIYFNVWTRHIGGGAVCTCTSNLNTGSLLESLPADSTDVNANRRQPIHARNPLDIRDSEDGDFKAFVFSTNDHAAVLNKNNPPPNIALDFNEPLDNAIDTLNQKLLMENLLQPPDEDELARMVAGSSTGAVYGGDKTPCGICFSTRYTGGYSLMGGQRVVLDASFAYNYSLHNGAIVDTNSHPHKFRLNSKSYVLWEADLTPYAISWLNFAVNNNLEHAPLLQLELFWNHKWQEVTLGLLLQLYGKDTSNMRLRVIPNPNVKFSNEDILEFTHAELSYITVPPLLGQAPQLPLAVNFEVVEPLISTNFELSASAPEIPRETVMQDSRTNLLWKVMTVTPQMTAGKQIFSYNVDVRKIASSESLYRLVLPFQLPTDPSKQIAGYKK
jgi:hypothetical protein